MTAARAARIEFGIGHHGRLEAQQALGGSTDQQALLTHVRYGSALAAAGRVDEGRAQLDEAVRYATRNVKRWRNGSMALRWAATAVRRRSPS